MLARDLERGREPRLAGGLVGPQAGPQPARVRGVGGVDRREVDAGAPHHRRRIERRDVRPDQLAGDRQRRGGDPGGAVPVVIGVAVPQQVQPRARPDLDQRERAPAGHGRERGEQAAAARDLVGLRAAGRERRGERLGALGAEGGEAPAARPGAGPSRRPRSGSRRRARGPGSRSSSSWTAARNTIAVPSGDRAASASSSGDSATSSLSSAYSGESCRRGAAEGAELARERGGVHGPGTLDVRRSRVGEVGGGGRAGERELTASTASSTGPIPESNDSAIAPTARRSDEARRSRRPGRRAAGSATRWSSRGHPKRVEAEHERPRRSGSRRRGG